ncbi:hypothetical protein INT46_011599 [Mucor plumbeus]|uniref:Tropomyosin n=1 Tax=Mucor plumbeus TaxID=97098 RepID=A0A8H7UTK5_9FUNG|nr:hypothetical protein INT46_011599 [Mucor plumbeus]
MEKFKEKLAVLRAEIDQANAKADEYRHIVNQLESDHIQKDHEIYSLQQKVKLIENQLNKTEVKLKSASANFQEANIRGDGLEKKTSKLELELEVAEKRNEEFKEMYKAAKEEMEALERELAGV